MARLTFLDLEPRLTPDAGMGAMGVTRDDPAIVTGAEVVRQDGRLWLVVSVSARCPACLLRANGIVRPVGDGVTEARFPVRPGTIQIDVEMSDPRGEFATVRRVRLEPDGRMVEPTAMGMDDDGMGMSMSGGMGAGMTTHAATVMPAAAHGEQPSSHAARPGPQHGGMVAAHPTAFEGGGMRMTVGHRGESAAASEPAAGHAADGGDPDDGHGERMAVQPTTWRTGADEEEPASPTTEVEADEVAPLPEPAAIPEPVRATSGVWSLVLGGAFVTAALVAAAHVVERQAHREKAGRRVVIRPPGRPDRRPARTRTTASPFEPRPVLQPVG